MVKKEQKKWYKRGWFIAIVVAIVIFCLFLYHLLVIEMNEQRYFESARSEYNQIYFNLEKTDDEIFQIGEKYNKNGLIVYSDFTKSELDRYVELLDVQERNIDELITWFIDNEKYFKLQGKTDFAIREMMIELRTHKQQLAETKIAAAKVQYLRDDFN